MSAFEPTLLSEEQVRDLELALATHFYRQDIESVRASDRGVQRLHDHVAGRYNLIARSVVPWVSRHSNLAGCNIVELGCGTGSSTAAFAQHCQWIDSFDVAAASLEVARIRLGLFGLDNANVVACPGPEIVQRATEREGRCTDVILLFAVLEHMTIAERIESLRRCWQCLDPGGLLVVADTPNRLTYHDYHTSWLPFFHLLPPELAAEYYVFSKREDFKDRIRRASQKGHESTVEAIIRDGLGVSYHELEVAIGSDIHDLVVADGFEPEIQAVSAETPEQKVLMNYLASRNVPIHRAFTRSVLAFILANHCDITIRREGCSCSISPFRRQCPSELPTIELFQSPEISMEEFVSTAFLLFVMLNPFLLTVYLLPVVQELDRRTFFRVVLRAGAISLTVFIFFSLAGNVVFEHVLHVRFAAFLLFGGLIFLVIGARMALSGASSIEVIRGPAEHIAGTISMPFMIGPGTISVSVLAGTRLGAPWSILALVAGVVATVLVILLLKSAYDHLHQRYAKLMQGYTEIVGRVSALVIGTISVEMILRGLELWLEA